MGDTPNPAGPFGSEAACIAWSHRYVAAECNQSPGGSNESYNFRGPRSAPNAVIAGCVIGCVLGGLGGSFANLPNGDSWVAPAAAIGAGLFSAILISNNTNGMSRAGAVAAAAVAGGEIGFGVGLAQSGQVIPNAQNQLDVNKARDDIPKKTAIGAGIGAGYILVEIVSGAKYGVLGTLSHTLARFQPIATVGRLGVNLQW